MTKIVNNLKVVPRAFEVCSSCVFDEQCFHIWKYVQKTTKYFICPIGAAGAREND